MRIIICTHLLHKVWWQRKRSWWTFDSKITWEYKGCFQTDHSAIKTFTALQKASSFICNVIMIRTCKTGFGTGELIASTCITWFILPWTEVITNFAASKDSCSKIRKCLRNERQYLQGKQRNMHRIYSSLVGDVFLGQTYIIGLPVSSFEQFWCTVVGHA